jgi:integrase
MSIWKPKNSPFYRYDFWLGGHRFHGATECTTRKEAKAVEAVERDKAKALVMAMKRSRASLLIDDVAARLWNDSAQHDADSDATSTNIARIVNYFGKAKPLTDIDHNEAKKMVAWRRGHHIKDRKKAPLISNATVNRSATKVLQRLFTFAKAEGAQFEHEPKWTELLLPEPLERVRELQDDEATALDAAMRADYEPFFEFVRASGLRQKECVTLRWTEVNFSTRQIVRIGKGGRRVVFPVTDAIREILFPLQGQHPEFVFTYVAIYGNKPLGRVRG